MPNFNASFRMSLRSNQQSAQRYSGFTLIELLTVIAIIGILAAITIPSVSKVRETAKKTKTRMQFTQWAAGVRLFKQTYGYYPRFEPTAVAGKHRVNGVVRWDSASMADNDYLFQELLSAKPAKPNGSSTVYGSTEADASNSIQNRKRQPFVTFDQTEISSIANSDRVDGALKDAFGNVEIAVLVDRNSDGFINDNDLASGVSAFPALTAAQENGTLTSATVLAKINGSDPSGKGVRADVIFYSPGKGGDASIDAGTAVWSW